MHRAAPLEGSPRRRSESSTKSRTHRLDDAAPIQAAHRHRGRRSRGYHAEKKKKQGGASPPPTPIEEILQDIVVRLPAILLKSTILI
jgi:hypothetical protein